MLLVVNELKIGETAGYRMHDFSKTPSDPSFTFYLKVVLMTIIGDYPGTGKVTRMHHSGFRACHWCWHRFDTINTGHQCAIHYRQHLSFSDSYRSHYAFGDHEHAAPPAPRMHNEYIGIARKLEDAVRAGKSKTYIEHEQRRNGIIGLSFLTYLQHFNIIWDVLPCYMHIAKGLWHKWIIPMTKGTLIERNKKPLPPQTTRTVAGETVKYSAPEMLVRNAQWSRKLISWQKDEEVPIIDISCTHMDKS